VPESITLNGTNLNTLVSNVEDLSGILRAPAIRGDNAVIPGRHGQLFKLERVYDVGTFPLPFWIIGADAVTGNTLLGDAAVTSFYTRVDELQALLHAGTLTFDHTLPNGSVRRAVAELTDEPLDFTRQLGSPLFGRVVAPVKIPGAFWVETSTTTQTLSGTTGSTLSFTSFANATAPMDELTITFGPSSNPRITQGRCWLQYGDVIASGRTAVFNSATWQFNGTGGLTMDFGKIAHVGSARWFELTPGTPLGTAPQLVLTHTGGGSASVTLSGNRKFLAG
jgi:hypothetical protein